METLKSLRKFVEEHPQKTSRNLNYIFIGGTAVRLNEEMVGIEREHRPISDFDLLVLNGSKKYPVHQCDLDAVFGLASLGKRGVENFIESYTIRDKEYYFANGTFLTLTKTCVGDTLRSKDYEDILRLHDVGLIDFERLKDLYKKAERITPKSDLVVDTLYWFLESRDVVRERLFSSFPNLVNLLGEFKHPEYVRDEFVLFAGDNPNLSGRALNSIVYDIDSTVRLLDDDIRLRVFRALLNHAKDSSYTDFSREIHQDILPKLRYATSKSQMNKFLSQI